MRRLRILLLVIGTLAADRLHAQDGRWTLITAPDREPNIRADFGSAKVAADDVVVIWVRSDFETDRTAEVVEDDGSRRTIRFRKDITHDIIDCAGGRYTFFLIPCKGLGWHCAGCGA